MSRVDDTTFWKRFSLAVHLNEEAQAESETSSTTTHSQNVFQKRSDSWLEQERKKRRRCKWLCLVVSLIFMALIGGVIALIWFAEYKMKGGSEYE